MRSLLLEFHRFNNLKSGIWREGDAYLIAAASHPVREYRMTMDQDDFLDLMLELRYQGEAAARLTALNKVGSLATQFLGSDSLTDISDVKTDELLQLDLVVNPAELAALPFEAATDSEGRPLFALAEQAVVLTRRVRHDFSESRTRWPASPRILYAWASPSDMKVPAAEHERALLAALEPWIPVQKGSGSAPDPGDVMTTLPEMSLVAFARTCRDAVDAGKPYTHVHVLAHGYPIGRGHRQRFGMALHSENGDLEAVTPEDLEQALAPLAGHAVVVTLATCDAANLTNTTTSKRSIAHNLHVLGFPIVVASQLPFTVPGSTLMVETFYKAQLAGEDVRLALHQARVALYQSQAKTGHDWASLVGYVQLPEGYADHLQDVRLQSILASLKTMQDWSDRLVKEGNRDPAVFDRVAQQLQERIVTLDRFRKSAENIGRIGMLEENLGLLGSAEKRLAELCFVRSKLGEAARWQQAMREALQRSRDWYRKCAQKNLSHHWTGVQYLSLEAILDGRIANPGRWYAGVEAANLDRENGTPKDAIWALGSLAELYLLAPLAGQRPPAGSAKEALTEMKARVVTEAGGNRFPIESTERQFRRYVDWWTAANGFFPGTSDLAAEAGSLLQELRR
jgi:CHAT domain